MHAARGSHIAPEAALRLPNAIVGAATTAVIFLLSDALFDTLVGAWAALIWAVDINAAAINRIGKEDTFLLFFLLLAAYCYERAKASSRAGFARDQQDRWYAGSAAAFGLMVASKYMPHYLGIHTLFNLAADDNPSDRTADKRWWFYCTLVLAFVVANIALVLPGTWTYLDGYVHWDTLRHTGYFFGHRVYLNTIDVTPWGVPPFFYLAFFVTKVPLGILAAAFVGLVWTIRHASHRGATFIRLFLLSTLLPYSLVSGKFLRYMLPALAVFDMAAAVGIAWIVRRIGDMKVGAWRTPVVAACAACVVAPSVAQQSLVGPYYGLAQNAIGATLAPRGWLFPDDEFYDAAVADAVAAIAATAAPHAVVCSDAQAVVAEYLARDGRPDMRACSIAHDGLPMQPVQTWVLAQDSHTYFENQLLIDNLRRRLVPWREFRVAGVLAVTVFRFR